MQEHQILKIKVDARKKFFDELIKLAEKDEKIWLLTGDLGYSFIEEFAKKFPERYVNVGIAEQNAIGIATGLCIAGYRPYFYSGAVFANYRCLEQIRDAWLQGLDVKVVGAGVSGFLGNSHNFLPWEREPLVHLAKKLKKTYIRL